jgi:hypothetical protein
MCTECIENAKERGENLKLTVLIFGIISEKSVGHTYCCHVRPSYATDVFTAFYKSPTLLLARSEVKLHIKNVSLFLYSMDLSTQFGNKARTGKILHVLKHHANKGIYQCHTFLTSALDGTEW